MTITATNTNEGTSSAEGAEELPAVEDLVDLRHPFLFLDKLTSLDPGVSATATWFVRPEHPILQVHFPGHPIMPGSLQIEALAQLLGACVVQAEILKGQSNVIGWLASVKKARFLRPVLPGNTIELSIVVSSSIPGCVNADGVIRVNGEVASKADLMLVQAGV